MANIHTLLDAIIDNGTTGKKVSIGVASKNEYETIRTRLVTLWSEHKTVILAVGGEDSDPLYPLSLCSSISKNTDDSGLYAGEFWLGKPRRKVAKSYSFTIVEPQEDSTTPTATVEAAPEAEAVNEPLTSIKLPAS